MNKLEIDEREFIILKSLYEPKYVIKGTGSESYYYFIAEQNDKHYPLILLDIKESEDGFFDIVHFFKVRERGLKGIFKGVGLPFPT